MLGGPTLRLRGEGCSLFCFCFPLGGPHLEGGLHMQVQGNARAAWASARAAAMQWSKGCFQQQQRGTSQRYEGKMNQNKLLPAPPAAFFRQGRWPKAAAASATSVKQAGCVGGEPFRESTPEAPITCSHLLTSVNLL